MLPRFSVNPRVSGCSSIFCCSSHGCGSSRTCRERGCPRGRAEIDPEQCSQVLVKWSRGAWQKSSDPSINMHRSPQRSGNVVTVSNMVFFHSLLLPYPCCHPQLRRCCSLVQLVIPAPPPGGQDTSYPANAAWKWKPSPAQAASMLLNSGEPRRRWDKLIHLRTA